MTTPLEKLDKLIPSTIDPDASDQDIINATYQNRLGEKMLAFIYQIQNNVRKRYNGGDMCAPVIQWTPTDTSVTINCSDIMNFYSVLVQSKFYKIANVYAKNVQTDKMYRYMRSQGKTSQMPFRITFDETKTIKQKHSVQNKKGKSEKKNSSQKKKAH